MGKRLDFLKNKIIAHRGYHDDSIGIPENSLKSFERAIENGYGIEIDLHLLKDGNIVVIHDDTTGRVTGVEKVLKDCTYDDIKDLKLRNTNLTIPLFKEVLDLVDGRVPLLIEYKYDNKPGDLEAKSMELLKEYRGEFAVQSFNPASVKWFKDNYENIPRGQLSRDYANDPMCFIKKFVRKTMEELKTQGIVLRAIDYGDKDKIITIYTEKYNAQDFTDPVTIIYGHNMKNGTMFTSLHRYEEQSFFDEHPYIYIYLPHAVYKYAIFSAVTFDDRYILGNYNFLDPDDFNSYISQISDSALGFVRDDLSVMPGNQVITLSTCLSNAPDKRYLVNAVLIETYQ